MNNRIFEWAGVTTAILYSLFVALNIGIEFIGFSLLLLSAILIGIWAYRGKHKGILLLQFFYASAGVIGMIRYPTDGGQQSGQFEKDMTVTVESYIGEVGGKEGVKLEQQYLVGENGLELMSRHPLEDL